MAIYQVKDYFSSVVIQNIAFEAFFDRPYFVVLMLLMSMVNWGGEAVKWMVVLPNRNDVSFLQSFRSVLVGLGISMFMPRLVGESIGRYSTHRGDKKDVITSLFLTKVFQSMTTFSFGFLGVVYFQEELGEWLKLPQISVFILVGSVLLLVLVFIKRIFRLIRTNRYFESLRQMNYQKALKLLLWSIVRYFTFYGQFLLVVYYLKIDIDVTQAFFALSTLFFIRVAMVSVNVVVDIGVRFASAIFVFINLGVITDVNHMLVIFSLVWAFNVIIPSLVGGGLILLTQNK